METAEIGGRPPPMTAYVESVRQDIPSVASVLRRRPYHRATSQRIPGRMPLPLLARSESRERPLAQGGSVARSSAFAELIRPTIDIVGLAAAWT